MCRSSLYSPGQSSDLSCTNANFVLLCSHQRDVAEMEKQIKWKIRWCICSCTRDLPRNIFFFMITYPLANIYIFLHICLAQYVTEVIIDFHRFFVGSRLEIQPALAPATNSLLTPVVDAVWWFFSLFYNFLHFRFFLFQLHCADDGQKVGHVHLQLNDR